MPTQQPHVLSRLVVCVRNDDAEDLVLRRIYPVRPDEAAEAAGLRRIIDDSGEDYLYPSDFFIDLHLARDLEQRLLQTA